MLFSVFWNTSLAYGIAVMFYQLATINRHPTSSLAWVATVLVFFAGIFIGLKRYANHLDRSTMTFPAAGTREAAL
jgi:ferrous iron transport protein B